MEILVRHGKAEFGVAKDSRQFIALMRGEMGAAGGKMPQPPDAWLLGGS
jgi:hypothetical protein